MYMYIYRLQKIMSETSILLDLVWNASINMTLMVLTAVYVLCKCCRVRLSTADDQTCYFISTFYLFFLFCFPFFSQALSLYSYNKIFKTGKFPNIKCMTHYKYTMASSGENSSKVYC